MHAPTKPRSTFVRCLLNPLTWAVRIHPSQVTFGQRGFYSSSPEMTAHLEEVGRAFLTGFDAALAHGRDVRLASILDHLDGDYRGFGFEGAAMGLALLDQLVPLNRWKRFLHGPASRHRYVLHVGYGWAVARLPWLRRTPERVLHRFDSVLRWLVLDGFGFHEGYFHWRRSLTQTEVRRRLSRYGQNAFDQGLGRSIWFVGGGDVRRVAELVRAFEDSRHADLWGGIGLACAYAGKVSSDRLDALLALAADYRPHLAQGAAFAATARQLAGIPAEHTDLACKHFCRVNAAEAAQIVGRAAEDLPPDRTDLPSYEVWRSRIREHLGSLHPSIALRNGVHVR